MSPRWLLPAEPGPGPAEEVTPNRSLVRGRNTHKANERKEQMTTDMVHMGAITEKRELNARSKLDHGVVSDYARRLRNGETPPPIELHAGTDIVFSGAHRFHAYKAFFGPGWEDREIPVIRRTDIPDPETEPELFRMHAAVENRDHGKPVTRWERGKLLYDVLKKFNKATARKYLVPLGETPESFAELMDVFSAPEIGKDDQKGVGAGAQTPATPWPAAGSPTGTLRAVRSAVRSRCETLRQAVEAAAARGLEDSERESLLELREYLDSVL